MSKNCLSAFITDALTLAGLMLLVFGVQAAFHVSFPWYVFLGIGLLAGCRQ